MSTPQERPLIRIIAGQIALYALVAMGLQVVIVFVEYYRDDANLARLVVEAEASRLMAGLTQRDGTLRYELPEAVERYATRGGSYLARIRTSSGTNLFSNCDQACAQHLLPADIDAPDFWLRQITPGKPITVAGGRSFSLGDGGRVLVELAILGDPQGVVSLVLRHELLDHMALPMALMLVFVLGATLLAVRRALRPVAEAAAQADRIDPRDPATRLQVEGMPREVAHLASAVNRAISRIADLIRSQRIFTAAVAHEIRTPLAMMKLQLGRIDDPRARKAEADLQDLAHFVEQVTSLARLEADDRSARHPVDPIVLSRSVVGALAPWVYDSRHGISFADRGGTPFLASPALVEDAVRNLIENAVRHTPPGTQITVEAGPGARIAVVDDAGAYRPGTEGDAVTPGIATRGGGLGIGLEIVRRIAAIYGAQFELAADPGRSTSASIAFPSDTPPPAAAPCRDRHKGTAPPAETPRRPPRPS